MSLITEIFSDKTVLLHSAHTASETVRCSRYLQCFNGCNANVTIEDTFGLEDIFRMIDSDAQVTKLGQNGDQHHNIEYDLNKLQFFLKSAVSRGGTIFPYICIPKRLKEEACNIIGNITRRKIGLCLHQEQITPPIKLSDIAHNLTIHQTLYNHYYSFVTNRDEHSFSNSTRMNYREFCLENFGYAIMASLIAEMDIVISFDNTIAHLAGALGKPVFLLVPFGTDEHAVTDFVDSYPIVTVFRQLHPDDWDNVFLEISLLSRFKPELPRFEPFNVQGTIVSDLDCRPLPNLAIESVNDLSKLLTADAGILANVFIETTSICNLRCPYCPNSTVGRDQEFMEEATFYRIVDSLKEYDENYTGLIAPHFYGEPLIDTRLEMFVRYIKNVHPLSDVVIYTNGELLSIARYKSLKEAGVNSFNISQHTDVQSKTLNDTIAYIKLNSLPVEDLCLTDMAMQKIKFNRGGLVDAEPIPEEVLAATEICIAAHRVMLFDYKGNAVICCNDYLSQHSYGNINYKSISDIWNGQDYRRIRNLVLYGYLPLPICRTCMYG